MLTAKKFLALKARLYGVRTWKAARTRRQQSWKKGHKKIAYTERKHEH